MTTYFDETTTGYEAQESLQKGNWNARKRPVPPKLSKLVDQLRSHADDNEIDLDELASNALGAFGTHTGQATAEQVKKIAEVEVSDFRKPLP